MNTKSNSQIAKSAGISRSFLCEIMKGKKTPSVRVARSLETATGIPAEAWMFPDRHPNPLLNPDEADEPKAKAF